jgi:hypothetical protein
MSTTTLNPKSTSRWQITLPKQDSISIRINNLLQKYEGMNLVEITKLALIQLDNNTITPTETDLIRQNTGLYSYLLQTKKDLDQDNLNIGKTFTTQEINDL